VGQWARRGYIDSSIQREIPRVYSFQDIAQAMVVHELIDRGVRHRDILRAVDNLRSEWGDWPLLEAPLATTEMRRKTGLPTHEFLVLVKGSTQLDAAHRAGTQTMLGLPLGLRWLNDLLRRGGWAMRDLPGVKNIEVDPDRLSGRPTIRNRRIPAEKVARIAATQNGRASLESDFKLTRRQIADAVKWYEAVSRFDKAA
jgi:uncharacterized protein (DUF433 family)